MTCGVTDEPVDAMSLDKIAPSIDAVRRERYRWSPARRTSIPKKNGKRRPLGIQTWSDKLLQEVSRLLLSAYFEPQFSAHSHGFRPGKGCHTARRDIYHTWPGTVWFIEGAIAKCFDSLSHEVLIARLREQIHDERFIRLIRNLLQAGSLEDWTWHATYSGAPQGSIVSPLLSNLYLDAPGFVRGDEPHSRLHRGRTTDVHPWVRAAQAPGQLSGTDWQAPASACHKTRGTAPPVDRPKRPRLAPRALLSVCC
jgi:retron-type reverse transcriptase